MLDVHLPHKAAHTWVDFFIHVATICVGLLIAIGLEQTVEVFHHRNQVCELEEQMHEVLENDRQFVAKDREILRGSRAWLIDLQLAIIARRQGKAGGQPPPDDPRSLFVTIMPNLAPYEAAKQNGVIALLDTRRLRLFNRIEFQHEMMNRAFYQWLDTLKPITALRMRSDFEPDEHLNFRPLRVPDLAKLSAAELAEYQALIGTSIAYLDQVVARLRNFDALCDGILGGATDEADLIRRASAAIEAERTSDAHTKP
jgi:hypothetical protein